MLANIKGLVERLELTPAKAMMPLFEGISNAIDAIEEHGDGFFKHAIRIRLVAGRDLAHQGGDDTLGRSAKPRESPSFRALAMAR